MIGLELDGLTNFWLKVSHEGEIKECSKFFQNKNLHKENFFDRFKFKHPKLVKGKNLYGQLGNMVLNFEVEGLEYRFRGTAHELGTETVILCWPFLTKLEEVKHHGLGQLMAHPACVTTDVLILKDILMKQQDKIRELEIEKVEKKLSDQIKINSHQAKLASIGVLASGVGHEINNPLMVINGHLQMLKLQLESKNWMNDVVEDRFDKVNMAIERITKIVKGLNSLSRHDETAFVQFNLSRSISDTIALIREIYLNEGITIKCDIKKNLYINGNPGRIQQVILNLLTNAKDALEGCEVKEILVTCKETGRLIEISVLDSGHGIPPEIRNKIFEPFFTTKAVNKGTGLGLALVNTIVIEHGGELTLDSEVGVGTGIHITFPQAMLVEDVKDSSEELSDVVFEGNALLVDDDDSVLEILAEILQSLGLKVIASGNGLEAFQLLSSSDQKIDVIFSDFKMPHLDGPGLYEKIRTKLNYKGRFYLITGLVETDPKHLKDGINGIITKPLSKDSLAKVLKEFLPYK